MSDQPNNNDSLYDILISSVENVDIDVKQSLVHDELKKQIEDSYSHHESIIDKIEEIWERTENNNNTHRTNIVGIVFGLIVAEILIISIFIFMSPFVKFPDHVIAQTFGLVTIMLRYLFNNKDDKFLEAISNIYKSNFIDQKKK